MDHIICINENSFPAEDKAMAKILFNDTLQGVLSLQNGQDRFIFYYDTNKNNLLDLNIASDYTYSDFVSECEDQDLKLFLTEIEDKSPAIDYLSEDQLTEISEYEFYIPEKAADDNTTIYSIAWTLSGYLLSLGTSEVWKHNTIDIRKIGTDGRYLDDRLTLNNIFNQESGYLHYSEIHNVNVRELIRPHIISDNLITWLSEQTKENQKIIIDKIKLCCEKNFIGGEPLLKTLDDGLKEIRMFAFSGGAIRILFKQFCDRRQALLIGFIKHSNTEGYTSAKKRAHTIFESIK